MKDDLTTNKLLDDGVKVAKTAMNVHDKAQKVIFYAMVAKWVTIGVVGLGLLVGGWFAINAVKEAVVDGAVVAVKEQAAEQTAAAREAVREKVEKTKAIDLSGVLTAGAKMVTDVVDGALESQGYHPDAPTHCLKYDPMEVKPLTACITYTYREIPADDYDTIKTLYPSKCPGTYEKVRNTIRETGKLTYNDRRILRDECDTNQHELDKELAEKKKQEILNGF